MLKFIVILILLLYVLNKVSVILFRVVGGPSKPTPPPSFRRPPEGNINMDGAPKKTRKGPLKGGEYVDFEEIK